VEAGALDVVVDVAAVLLAAEEVEDLNSLWPSRTAAQDVKSLGCSPL
jgi:hypothetical protein